MDVVREDNTRRLQVFQPTLRRQVTTFSRNWKLKAELNIVTFPPHPSFEIQSNVIELAAMSD